MTSGEHRLIAGKYRLREVLGEGGLGVVWRARDESLDRDVAVKEVRLPVGIDAEQVSSLYIRTLREARAAAKLADPGIVVVHEVVHEDDRPWIVMELVGGRTLQQVIDEDGPQSPEWAARVGGRVLASLRAVHRADVVHRDIKPSNILLDGERTVLTDFGIAALDGSTMLTRTGAVLGTPAFMSPEQAHGRAVTPASDLWSLGATLYATVEGRPPFEGESLAAVIAALLANDPPPPRRAGALAPVIAELMVTDPDLRTSADDLAARLSRVASGEALGPESPDTGPLGAPLFGSPPGAAKTGPPRWSDRTVSWRRRPPARPLAVLTALAVVLVVAAGTIAAVAARSPGHPATRPSSSPAAQPAVPVVRLGTRFPSARIATDTNVFTVAYSPDGRTLAVGGSVNPVYLYDVWRRTQTAQLPGHTDSVDQVSFSPDGRQLATASDDKTVRLWDLKSGSQTAKLTGFKSNVWSVEYSPDGKTLVTGSKDDNIRVWDVASRKLLRVVRGHTDSVNTVRFSPDGKTLASASWDETVRLWDTATWTQKAILRGHTDGIHSIAFSPDGKSLASGGADHKVLLWNLTTHAQTGVLSDHSKEIWSVAFSPDGRTVASCGTDHKVILNNAATGARIATLTGHKGQVDWVTFSPDGKTLASGAEDKSIRLWDLTR